MKKKFLVMIMLFMPFLVFAHGGVSKNIGNTIVFLNQEPLSPLVGESVTMTFSITDKNFKAVPNLPLELTLTDTFGGDESKDKVIDMKNITTDVNGAFQYSYTFQKDNYFDVDVHFKDPVSGEALETGFLIQTRKVPAPWRPSPALIAGIVTGLLAVVVVKQVRK